MRCSLLLLFACGFGGAQTQDDSLTFEVAAVKVAGGAPSGAVSVKKSVAGAVTPSADPIRFSRRNATLASLLLTAYSLKPQLPIGPDWLNSERYEIEAKVPDGATAQQRLAMLRNPLAERFRVKVHRETGEMPVYAMVIAKGGPKLKELAPGTSALPALRPGGPLGLSRRGGMAAIGLHEQGGMDALAARLSSQADRPIVDRTGLKGNYEILLRWTPPRASASADSAGDPGISLFDALGRLKIEYRRF